MAIWRIIHQRTLLHTSNLLHFPLNFLRLPFGAFPQVRRLARIREKKGSSGIFYPSTFQIRFRLTRGKFYDVDILIEPFFPLCHARNNGRENLVENLLHGKFVAFSPYRGKNWKVVVVQVEKEVGQKGKSYANSCIKVMS